MFRPKCFWESRYMCRFCTFQKSWSLTIVFRGFCRQTVKLLINSSKFLCLMRLEIFHKCIMQISDCWLDYGLNDIEIGQIYRTLCQMGDHWMYEQGSASLLRHSTWIPWNLSFRYVPCTGQFTPKMKQTRNRVCFHLWCELTLALWCHSIVWSLFSWNKM